MLQKQSKYNLANKFVTGLAFVVLSSLGFLQVLQVSAQTSTNEIGLYIPVIKKASDGVKYSTKKVGDNSYEYTADELTLDDEIRYGWSGADLDLQYKNSPMWGGGYLKIYLNNDSSEDNFITDYGSSPLPVSKIAHRLSNGENKILLVYITKGVTTETSKTKVAFTFKYKNDTTKPEIEVVSPAQGTVLASKFNTDFVLRLENFSLESQDSGQLDRGKLNIYYTEVKKDNLIGTVASSIKTGEYSEVVFSSEDYENFSRIPDSLNSKLIFVLTKSNGELLDYKAELKVKTNYKGTIDVGLPSVTIIEPSKDFDLVITGDREFRLEIKNFELLNEINTNNLEDGKGYLQIWIDGELKKEYFNKTSFTLNEINADTSRAGPVEIKVNLTNKKFEHLTPKAEDSITVEFEQSAAEEESEVESKKDIWRIIIMVLTVVLIIGSIAVLITKG